jgi:S-DNA-T family DNA segregation ATPase FtsK/SpoIIIE
MSSVQKSSIQKSAAQKRRPVARSKNQKAATLQVVKGKTSLRARAWVRDTCSVLLFGLGAFLFLSLGSHVYGLLIGASSEVARNLMGHAGHVVAKGLFDRLGVSSVLPVVGLVWLAIFRLGGDQERPQLYPRSAVAIGACLLLVALSTTSALLAGSSAAGAAISGSVGSAALVTCSRWLGVGGTAIAMGLVALVSCAVLLQQSIGDVAQALRIVAQTLLWLVAVKLPLLASRAALILAGAFWGVFQRVLYALSKLFVLRAPADETESGSKGRKSASKVGVASDWMDSSPGDSEAVRPSTPPKRGYTLGVKAASEPPPVERADPIIVKPKVRDSSEVKTLRSAPSAKSKSDGDTAPGAAPQFDDYEPPDVALLTREDAQQLGDDDNELRQKAEQIELKLRDFNIAGRVTQVHPGPVITLFEFEPAAGVKVGRIAALQDDLAMSLKASSIRIIAPLPKRGTVGIEVPNKHRAVVRLRDCLESQAFASADSILSVPLGKDTYGDSIVVDIASMPHLLMAGATGTGKSVSINALLLSLLYRAHPSELGLILIDPKVLELSIYEGIPHLRVPVVTDPRQAKGVLSWAVKEMDRRYRYMQKFGVRNIDGYNRVVSGKPPIDPDEPPISNNAVQMQMFDEKAAESAAPESESDKQGTESNPESIAPEQLKPLPKLVIVIDELADLMLSVGRDIEELITRLAQKARAAGIHLIVATQRPSVDVITGLIKANFPARLSFRVSSRIDSRTILDSMGAEKLLGKGDMLFMLPGAVPLKRVHGAFVSDQEVQKVVTALKANCAPQYDEAIIAACDKAMSEGSGEEDSQGGEGGAGVDEEFDPFYDKAVELVIEKGQASTSMIQRTFRIGYNRAARIIETMEREGVVGKMDGIRPREVIVPSRSSES